MRSLCYFTLFFLFSAFPAKVVFGVVRLQGNDQEQESLQLEVPETPTTRIHLSLSRIEMGSLKFYKELYGAYSVLPMIGVDRVFISAGPITFGWGMKLGYYSDRGNTAKKVNVDNPQASEIKKEAGGSVLTLIPIQLLLNVQLSPFAREHVTFDFWGGFEDLIFEEFRTLDDEGSASESNKTPLNSGGHNNLVFGLGISASLNSIFGEPSRAVKFLGITNQFISFFAEFAAKPEGEKRLPGNTEASKPDFSRNSVGVSFVFATQ